MPMTRRTRTLAALLAVVHVLLAQLAVPAYACPMLLSGPATVETMAGEPGCGGESLVAGEKGLCRAHCLQGDQTIEKRALVPMDSLAAIPAMALRVSPPEARSPAIPERLPLLLARDTAPSLAVRHCCFRF
ncbi:MAG: hypothetical protein AB7P08_05835 [Burkholderiales bacterium]